MKVLHSKDLASHADLESCAAYREVRSGALIEARIGQPSSRESWFSPGADAVHGAEGKTDGRAIASALPTRRGPRPWHVRTLLVREPGDLGSDQLRYRAGPHREGEEP